MTAFRCKLTGRVQGVGFRYYTYQQAQKLGIRGWVRNVGDDAVEIQAEGEPETIESFIERVRSGPSLAFVENVEIKEVELENHEQFAITR